jgi:hypothetical protein
MKFQIGHTYYDRSLCDHECVFFFMILARTAKTVTFTYQGETKRRGLTVYNGVEQFRPFGTYSMCAIVGADSRMEGGV